MDEDFSTKIEQLKDMLNNGQLPDNLKNLMSQLNQNSKDSKTDGLTSQSNDEIDALAMITKVKTMLDKKNRIDDPRINLLNAIKPYLNSKRQERVDGFVKVLNVTFLSTILKDENL